MLFFICFSAYLQAQEIPDTTGIYKEWEELLKEVVITAQYAPTDARNALHDIELIKKEKILQRGASNLEELLTQETGIRINQDMILGSGISMQGLSGENVKILIDGIPVIGRLGGNIDMSQIQLDNVQRIEVIEGPLAVNYGTDALAGVINIITKKSQANKYEIGIQSGIESIGIKEFDLSSGIRVTDEFTIRVNGGWRHFKGLGDEGLRYMLWNPKKQWNAGTSLTYRFNENQRINLSGNFFHEEVINLGEERRPQFKPYAFDDYYFTQRINPYFSYEGKTKKDIYFNTVLSYNDYLRNKKSYRYDFENDSLSLVLGQQDTSRFREGLLRSTVAYTYENKLGIQAGIELAYSNAQGQRINDSNSSKSNFSALGDYAMFWKLRYDILDNLALEGGLRYTYNTEYKAPFIPSVHFKYSIKDRWFFRASYGKGFRAPSLKELYYNFIDINHFIVGNTSLLAERSDNIQVSGEYRKNSDKQNLKVKWKGFYNHIQNRIGLYEFIETENGNVPAIDTSTLQFTYFNQSVYKTLGSAFKFSYQFNNFTIGAGLTVTGYYNELHKNTMDVKPFTYSFELANELSYQHPKHHFGLALYYKQNDKIVSYYPDMDENGNEFVGQSIIGGYGLVDLIANKSLWKQRIRISLGVKNLFDITEVDLQGDQSTVHGSNANTTPINMGRNVFLKLGFNFNKK